ncbi:hypothetical protein C8Q75DRAFT_266823 [Abortiporus biennis]|nr:hypothetical protein C8Q75DRAFT_266823 [Abortiporus biennis]
MWQVRIIAFQPNDIHVFLNEKALALVDAKSRQKLKQFYHKEDAFRGLIARLLPRLLVKEYDIGSEDLFFGTTQHGKPYMTIASAAPIGYNITHDNGLIGMVYSTGDDLFADPPAYRLGIDVMKLSPPKGERIIDFINIFSEQLTALERSILLTNPPLPESETLRRFYLIWTLKEAYTKALGLGLGFDFRQIEYDVPRDKVRINGNPPIGWQFVRFQVNNMESGQEYTYVGVAARFVSERNGGEQEVEGKVESEYPNNWLKIQSAVSFMEEASLKLGNWN